MGRMGRRCERLREGSQGKCWIITDLMYIYIVLTNLSHGTVMFSVFCMNTPHVCECMLGRDFFFSNCLEL